MCICEAPNLQPDGVSIWNLFCLQPGGNTAACVAQRQRQLVAVWCLAAPHTTTTASGRKGDRLRYLLQGLHQLLFQVALSSLFLQTLKSQNEMEGFCSQGVKEQS